ncbi:hypothetical protein FY557_14055 [Chryseobacterium sp. SN22]|uniref:hypothetical protein n=1 Tax=Chryseobacterium sp. SN22 TaxID=2606431 RepID=UPI0011EF0C99|nr:hypothetical protein [Chryseobacterium sp. SN22]KAA0127108.1 hypothetical protein FY557_14055 [Chryseobacterium sp. SN22]
MKTVKIFIIAFTGFSASAFSQVIMGDATGTATNKSSVLLEFANTNNKGIIVPYVRTLPASPTQGTILLDAVNATQARMRYYNGSSWIDMSGQNGNIASIMATQPSAAESVNEKVIIGATASSANGAVVLESANRAMVLPIVTDVNNIPSPSPGMMVYVNKTGAKRLAVYNGERWSFWAPQ